MTKADKIHKNLVALRVSLQTTGVKQENQRKQILFIFLLTKLG